jgi:hypothetical protein
VISHREAETGVMPDLLRELTRWNLTAGGASPRVRERLPECVRAGAGRVERAEGSPLPADSPGRAAEGAAREAGRLQLAAHQGRRFCIWKHSTPR